MSADASIRELFARNRGGAFELEVVPREAFSDALLGPLHEMSNALMAEPLEHFAWHARTNDVLHVFRRASSDRIEGFQFWRSLPGSSERQRIVLGGKLRIRPEARRRGLHLCSGLTVLLDQRRRFPSATITRIGVASLFGFVSITKRVSRYDFVDAASRPDLVDIVEAVTRASHYRFDPRSGQVEVGIFVTPEQLSGYPASFFDEPAARAYLARNPEFRTNGRYLAFAFDVDHENLSAIARGAAETALGETAEARLLGDRLIGV